MICSSCLTRWLTALGVTEPVHVVGHDWGGCIGMGAATVLPDRFGRFVLVSTNFSMVNHFIPDHVRFATAGDAVNNGFRLTSDGNDGWHVTAINGTLTQES